MSEERGVDGQDRSAAPAGGPARGGRSRHRTDAERLADHAAIDRLTDELLPALVAKLTASGLGELEVSEGDWRVRLRMPSDGHDRAAPRRTGASARSASPVIAASVSAAPTMGVPAPRHPEATAAGARGGDATRPPEPHAPRPRAVAASPAVGVYRPRAGLAVGSRVRAGDRLGVVDVLGVPHDVLAPADGVVGGSYVDPGDGVEYGQELIRIELASGPATATPPPAAPGAKAKAAPSADAPAARDGR